MSELTAQERELRDRRRALFAQFVDEAPAVLAHFLELLGLPRPQDVVTDAWRFLPAVDEWVASQVIADEGRIWLTTRLVYFVGELLNQRYAGSWYLNEIPDSRYFLRYVVGRFEALSNPYAMVDPFEPMKGLLSQPTGRSLSGRVAGIEAELEGLT